MAVPSQRLASRVNPRRLEVFSPPVGYRLTPLLLQWSRSDVGRPGGRAEGGRLGDDPGTARWHPDGVRPQPKSHATDRHGLKTVCHRCFGDGAVAHPRATVLTGYGPVWGYEAKPCPDCGGREWLAGLTPPA